MMIRNLMSAVVSLAIVATAAFAQNGTVVSVDQKKSEIVVKVAEQNYTADAAKITLLDKDGKAAKLSDFSAKDKVNVTLDGEKVTKIQRAADGQLFAVQGADDGSVVRIDAEHSEMVVKVGTAEHTVVASKIKLLDKNGKDRKLSDFTAGDKIKVTFEGEKITQIQEAK